ncbi:MAG: arsenate reductase ArsC [Rhodoferax sp.]|uniref:arsenate reductase ArsC n=1 Tax=Rhodoferax sp. TaxID=50421 RepID=UPI0030177A2A
MSDKVFNVLFLCTCNTARSLLAEAQLNALGKGRFRAFSAGSFPTGTVNSNAIEFLQHIGLPTEGLYSKSWDEFANQDAPVMDFILTLCDDAVEDQCPIWPGHPVAAHWSVTDPGKVKGSAEEKQHAFLAAGFNLRKRLELFISLPTDSLDRMSLKYHLDEIGKSVCDPA